MDSRRITNCKSYKCNHPLDPEEYDCDEKECIETGECKEFDNLTPCIHNDRYCIREENNYCPGDKCLDEEYQKCVESEEYFYTNYVKTLPGNNKLPDYTPEVFQDYINKAEKMREIMKNPILKDVKYVNRIFRFTPDDAFSKTKKDE